MRLVLDTDVIVASFRSPTGASAELLRMAERKQVILAVSVALMLEYEAVLTRPEHFEAGRTDKFLTLLCDLAQPVRIHLRWRPQTADPADDHVLEAAINSRADALASFNVRDFGKAPGQFGIIYARPGNILEMTR